MRDILVLILLAGGIGLTLYRPWLGVLVLAFFGYANPHRYAWGVSATLPVYQILLLVAFFALLITKDRQALPKDWRIPIFYLLWAWFLITTIASPLDSIAWQKLWDVSKLYIPLILTLYLINTPRKLLWLLVTIGFSFGLLAAKGGIFAITNGFNYRVWGPDGTMYGGNNEFAIATLVSIPLLALTYRQLKTSDIRWGKYLAFLASACIPLAVSSALSSWSRGALVSMGVLFILVWWNSRHKILLLILVGAVVANATAFLPSEWFSRMETINTYQEDASAMGRIEAWRDGINFVLQHPILGAGLDGWRYVTARDWHSSYVEILSEHGFPGAILWMLLTFGTLLSLTRMILKIRKIPELSLHLDMAIMIRASILAYMAGSLTLGITYWDLIYQLVFCAILLKQFVNQTLDKMSDKVSGGA